MKKYILLLLFILILCLLFFSDVSSFNNSYELLKKYIREKKLIIELDNMKSQFDYAISLINDLSGQLKNLKKVNEDLVYENELLRKNLEDTNNLLLKAKEQIEISNMEIMRLSKIIEDKQNYISPFHVGFGLGYFNSLNICLSGFYYPISFNIYYDLFYNKFGFDVYFWF